jgi:hypothetical protein
VWNTQQANPHGIAEHEHDSPKTSLWCALMKDKVIGSFLFEDCMVTTLFWP